jgi:hypothetical protein
MTARLMDWKASIRAFFDKVEPTTLAILFDFAHDLVRKVCNFSGSCARPARRYFSPEDIGQWLG